MWIKTTEKLLIEVAASYLLMNVGARVNASEQWRVIAVWLNWSCEAKGEELKQAVQSARRKKNKKEAVDAKALLEEFEAVFPDTGYTGQQCRDKVTALAAKVRPDRH